MVADQSEIHRLSLSEIKDDRLEAVRLLKDEFRLLPDRSAAWDDLHRLRSDEEWEVRSNTVSVIGSTISFVPERYKTTAWSDIQRLTSDTDSSVRESAAEALVSAFSSVPENSAAWSDLHSLIFNEDWRVRSSVAYAIGSAFSFVPDKSAARSDLQKLTNDEDWYVKMHANHSLGKICIYYASKAENEVDSLAIFEDAIQYYEKAANEPYGSNPATFCSHFYRSFDAVLFKKVHSKKEIEEYIAAAKKEINGSESNQKLIQAVEELAEALETAHNAHESGVDWQKTLQNCSDICNRVDTLMDEIKDKTPDIHNLYKIAKPSFDEHIQKLIDEVKATAKIACKEARGTPTEPVVRFVNTEIQKWIVGNQEQMEMNLNNLIDQLKIMIPIIPKNELLISKINSMNNCTAAEDVLGILITVLPLIPKMDMSEDIDYIKTNVDYIKSKVDYIENDIEQLITLIMKQPNPQEYLDTIQQIMEQIMDKLQKNNENTELKEKINKVLYELRKPEKTEFKLKFTLPLIPKVLALETEKNVSDIVYEDITKLKSLINKLNK